jgi:DNA invertase Pin-like site-specific DNA recombinase
MRIGYARVSTDDQTLDLQRDALKRAKCRQIYEEHASGKNTARPQLEACLKSLREGDTLIVWRLDRLGRSLGDLIRLTHDPCPLAGRPCACCGTADPWCPWRCLQP